MGNGSPTISANKYATQPLPNIQEKNSFSKYGLWSNSFMKVLVYLLVEAGKVESIS